jgi:NAD(P)-dependent dehydrogenase (short-subunit alcohol dehydrogenase family)
VKSLLITGASSGIGRATALAAASSGWQVIACGRDEGRLAALREQDPRIRTLAFDLADPIACREHLRGLAPDVAILNAGSCEYIDVDDWDTGAFRRVFEANFFSAVHCVEAMLPDLAPGAQLVFVDSLARLLPFTRSQAYGASKAAVHYLARSLQVDLRQRGILVQNVSPGFVRTPLTDRNDFAMPMRVEPEQAAAEILRCVRRRTRSGYFPTVFAAALRLLGSLPGGLQLAVCGYLARREGASQ